MKKIIYFVITIFMIILFSYPLKSRALENATFYLQSDKDNVIIGDEFEVSLNLKEINTSAYSIEIFFDTTKLEFISGPENSNVIGNKVKIVWYDTNGGTEAKQGELEKLKFKSIAPGIADFDVNGEFFDENINLMQTDFENFQIEILEQDVAEDSNGRSIQKQNSTQLKSLRLNVEGIVPDFETDIYDYSLTLPEQLKEIKDIEVQTIAENENAKIEVSGNKNLKDGLNIINVVVTNQGKSQEYKIKVTKTQNLEMANTNLENLAIEYAILSPEFNEQITRYNTQVANEINQLNILAIPENEKGKVDILGNNNLNEGNNKIEIKVTAPNGFTQRIYEINVYKRNKQEETMYDQEVDKVKKRLEEAYSVNKEVSENDNSGETMNNDNNEVKNEKRENKKDYLLMAVDVFIVVSIIIGFLTYKNIKRD